MVLSNKLHTLWFLLFYIILTQYTVYTHSIEIQTFYKSDNNNYYYVNPFDLKFGIPYYLRLGKNLYELKLLDMNVYIRLASKHCLIKGTVFPSQDSETSYKFCSTEYKSEFLNVGKPYLDSLTIELNKDIEVLKFNFEGINQNVFEATSKTGITFYVSFVLNIESQSIEFAQPGDHVILSDAYKKHNFCNYYKWMEDNSNINKYINHKFFKSKAIIPLVYHDYNTGKRKIFPDSEFTCYNFFRRINPNKHPNIYKVSELILNSRLKLNIKFRYYTREYYGGYCSFTNDCSMSLSSLAKAKLIKNFEYASDELSIYYHAEALDGSSLLRLLSDKFPNQKSKILSIIDDSQRIIREKDALVQVKERLNRDLENLKQQIGSERTVNDLEKEIEILSDRFNSRTLEIELVRGLKNQVVRDAANKFLNQINVELKLIVDQFNLEFKTDFKNYNHLVSNISGLKEKLIKDAKLSIFREYYDSLNLFTDKEKRIKDMTFSFDELFFDLKKNKPLRNEEYSKLFSILMRTCVLYMIDQELSDFSEKYLNEFDDNLINSLKFMCNKNSGANIINVKLKQLEQPKFPSEFTLPPIIKQPTHPICFRENLTLEESELKNSICYNETIRTIDFTIIPCTTRLLIFLILLLVFCSGLMNLLIILNFKFDFFDFFKNKKLLIFTLSLLLVVKIEANSDCIDIHNGGITVDLVCSEDLKVCHYESGGTQLLLIGKVYCYYIEDQLIKFKIESIELYPIFKKDYYCPRLKFLEQIEKVSSKMPSYITKENTLVCRPFYCSNLATLIHNTKYGWIEQKVEDLGGIEVKPIYEISQKVNFKVLTNNVSFSSFYFNDIEKSFIKNKYFINDVKNSQVYLSIVKPSEDETSLCRFISKKGENVHQWLSPIASIGECSGFTKDGFERIECNIQPYRQEDLGIPLPFEENNRIISSNFTEIITSGNVLMKWSMKGNYTKQIKSTCNITQNAKFELFENLEKCSDTTIYTYDGKCFPSDYIGHNCEIFVHNNKIRFRLFNKSEEICLLKIISQNLTFALKKDKRNEAKDCSRIELLDKEMDKTLLEIMKIEDANNNMWDNIKNWIMNIPSFIKNSLITVICVIVGLIFLVFIIKLFVKKFKNRQNLDLNNLSRSQHEILSLLGINPLVANPNPDNSNMSVKSIKFKDSIIRHKNKAVKFMSDSYDKLKSKASQLSNSLRSNRLAILRSGSSNLDIDLEPMSLEKPQSDTSIYELPNFYQRSELNSEKNSMFGSPVTQKNVTYLEHMSDERD